MTKEAAINVLDELQKASRALDPNKARQAFDALMLDTHVVTTAFNLAAEFVQALGTLRRVFAAMDNKGIRFPSN